MFKNREIVCAIEFGTSKIAVLLGQLDAESNALEVVGRGECPSRGAVVKGEIRDVGAAASALEKALDEADASSGGALADCRMAMVLVTGCGIFSQSAVGSTVVKNPEHLVTELEVRESEDNARVLNLSGDREVVNSSTSYYLVDGVRVSNPIGRHGMHLETHVHIVHGVALQLETFRHLVGDCGFANIPVELVFSPLAASCGIISEAERENGVLLVDLGMGSTEYLVEFDNGVAASGVLQVGFDHVANDLAIGLDLHIDVCRKLLTSGAIEAAHREGKAFLEFPGVTGSVRRIPLASFDTIIDARLREIFEIIRKQLIESHSPLAFGAGAVLTGGGALYYRSREILNEVFDVSCQVRRPADAAGAVTDLANPRYSALWGALKVAAMFSSGRSRSTGALEHLVNGLSRMFDRGRSHWNVFKKSIKF